MGVPLPCGSMSIFPIVCDGSEFDLMDPIGFSIEFDVIELFLADSWWDELAMQSDNQTRAKESIRRRWKRVAKEGEISVASLQLDVDEPIIDSLVSYRIDASTLMRDVFWHADPCIEWRKKPTTKIDKIFEWWVVIVPSGADLEANIFRFSFVSPGFSGFRWVFTWLTRFPIRFTEFIHHSWSIDWKWMGSSKKYPSHSILMDTWCLFFITDDGPSRWSMKSAIKKSSLWDIETSQCLDKKKRRRNKRKSISTEPTVDLCGSLGPRAKLSSTEEPRAKQKMAHPQKNAAETDRLSVATLRRLPFAWWIAALSLKQPECEIDTVLRQAQQKRGAIPGKKTTRKAQCSRFVMQSCFLRFRPNSSSSSSPLHWSSWPCLTRFL